MVDILVLKRSDWLLLILKMLFLFVSKQTTLMKKSTVTSLPLQLVFPAVAYASGPLCFAPLLG
jgi:hypothetical protein